MAIEKYFREEAFQRYRSRAEDPELSPINDRRWLWMGIALGCASMALLGIEAHALGKRSSSVSYECANDVIRVDIDGRGVSRGVVAVSGRYIPISLVQKPKEHGYVVIGLPSEFCSKPRGTVLLTIDQ